MILVLKFNINLDIMKKIPLYLIFIFQGFFVSAQYNMEFSNPEAEAVFFGNYNPDNYLPSVVINHPDSILFGVVNDVSKDSLYHYLEHIDSYYNRNSGSDTVSETNGIGAVRRWIHKKLVEVSGQNENRLLVTYLTFDANICGQYVHRDVIGILPGLDTSNKEILVIEGHYDTRCEGVCDTSCYSPGMEDNGSGTVLVMELARIMSKYAFNHTILFTLTTGEDQGLYGAKALAWHLWQNDLEVKAVLNNDMIGGVICGNTSSPPSCPYMNHVDSTHVRIFSKSSWDDSSAVSPHKQLARYIQMNQVERINPLLATPMNINIIISEDRVGRSGDHIPFRERGYTAIRFCSQNEHGNGSGTPPDRQHTTNDILGVDTTVPPDGIIDSFYVDMGYLRRNSIMNGVNLGLLAISPPTPSPAYMPIPHGVEIQIQGADTVYKHYRVGVRSKGSGTLNFDSILTFQNTTSLIIDYLPEDKECYFSVANVNNGVESLFSSEYTTMIVGTNEIRQLSEQISLYQNQPNPVTSSTEFVILSQRDQIGNNTCITINDLMGRVVQRLNLTLSKGKNKIRFQNNSGLQGVYTYSLLIDNQVIKTRKIVFLQ